jgi:hypothetical protein
MISSIYRRHSTGRIEISISDIYSLMHLKYYLIEMSLRVVSLALGLVLYRLLEDLLFYFGWSL